MAQKQPLELHGQPVGRLKASWLLFKEAWRFLKADTEMLWIPLITAVLNLLLFGTLIAGFGLLIMGGDITLSQEGEPSSTIELVFLFLCYVIGAFTFALSQAAITNTVYTRVHNGDATLLDSLRAAFSHWFSLLLWSIITSTVGLVLRVIAERSRLGIIIVAAVLGVAWSVLTYFVVPAMVIDKKSAFASIGTSARVFKMTWGETIVSNIGLGLALLVIHLGAIFSVLSLSFLCFAVGLELLVIPILIIYALFIVIMVLIQASLEGVLKTLLYVYAAEGVIPPNFDRELLEKMLARKDGSTPTPPAATATDTNQHQTDEYSQPIN